MGPSKSEVWFWVYVLWRLWILRTGLFWLFFLLLNESLPVMSNSWTVASQAPLSMKISRPEYWSRQPYSSPRDLPNPGIKSRSPTLWADSLPSEPPEYYKAHKFKFSKAFKIQEFNSVFTFSWFSPLPMHNAFNLNIRLPTCLITHNCDKSINQRQYST